MTEDLLAKLIVLFDIALAGLWDLAARVWRTGTTSYCEACREINRGCNGLLALGAVALWVHIFAVPILPGWWTEQ